MPLPFDNMQASLALTQFLPLSGIFPANNSDPTADPLGVPLGSIRTFAGNFALGGSAQAEGQLLAINQNQALFALLGTMYGGNGTTNFGLPDLRGRVPVGWGQGRGLSPYNLGQKGGEEAHTIISQEMGSHTHNWMVNNSTPATANTA